MLRRTRDQALMDTARVWAGRSTCSRAQVGAVVSREGRILTLGYNGAPAGMKHCDHSCNCAPELYQDKHLADCSSQQPCTISVHAEANVIAFAAKYGVSLDGAELHTTRVPCLNCAMLVINAGIGRIVWDELHRDMRGAELLTNAGVEVVRYSEWGYVTAECICRGLPDPEFDRICPIHGEKSSG